MLKSGILLSFLLCLSILNIIGQETIPETSKPEPKESTPVEAPRNDPPPPPRNDPPPRNESNDSSSRRNDDSRERSSRNNDSESDRGSKFKVKENEENVRPPAPRNNGEGRERNNRDSERERNRDGNQGNRDENRNEGREHRRDKNESSNPRNNDETNREEIKREEEKRRRWEQQRRRWEEEYRRNRDAGIMFPNPYPTIPASSTTSFRRYFDAKDVIYNTFDSFIENDAGKCQLVLNNASSTSLEPLFPAYIREYFTNEFPFFASGWAMYYETELDDFFIDFSKFGNHEFSKIILTPVGDLSRKVAKKLDKQGMESHPTILENLPLIQTEKIYSFNLTGLPKGDYELRLIDKDCFTVRKIITIK